RPKGETDEGCAMQTKPAELSIAIKRLLERRIAQPAIGGDERLFGAGAMREIGIDQLLDGLGHGLGLEARPHDLAHGRVLGGVASDGDLVEFGALLLDPQYADMAGVMMAAGVDAAGDLDLERPDLALALGRREAPCDPLCDRDRAR